MLNFHPPKPTFKDLTLCSIWQQTSNHSKLCSYHIRYPNLACTSSLTTRRICAPNFKLYTQISKKLCDRIQKGFMKVESSTWQKTSSHSKHYSYHIHYLNLVCLSSLES